MRILSRRDYTRHQMEEKLRQKGFVDEDIEEVLDYLEGSNLINDNRYAENFVYFKLKDGYGKRRIEYELKRRGVKDEIINRWLDGVDETDSARGLVRKRVECESLSPAQKRKLFAYLARRGYEYDTIYKVLSEEGDYEVK